MNTSSQLKATAYIFTETFYFSIGIHMCLYYICLFESVILCLVNATFTFKKNFLYVNRPTDQNEHNKPQMIYLQHYTLQPPFFIMKVLIDYLMLS